MTKPRCSHKVLEWKDYKENKKPGDGLMPPSKYCQECETTRELKGK
jgi:hypothetical protein